MAGPWAGNVETAVGWGGLGAGVDVRVSAGPSWG